MATNDETPGIGDYLPLMNSCIPHYHGCLHGAGALLRCAPVQMTFLYDA